MLYLQLFYLQPLQNDGEGGSTGVPLEPAGGVGVGFGALAKLGSSPYVTTGIPFTMFCKSDKGRHIGASVEV